MPRTRYNHDYNFDHPSMDEHHELQADHANGLISDREYEHAVHDLNMRTYKPKEGVYEYPFLYPH